MSASDTTPLDDEQSGVLKPLSDLPRWVTAILPIVLLLVILLVFVITSPLAGLTAGEPLPDLTISHTTIPDESTIILHVTNNGPDPVTISQVLVNEAYWSFNVQGTAGQSRTIQPTQSARVVIPYHWEPGWDLGVNLVLTDGTTIEHTITAPQQSPTFDAGILWTLALIGIFVGVIPVSIGILWFPFIQSVSDHWLHAVLMLAVGVLTFLAADALFESFEIAELIPGAYEGELLVVLGILGAWLSVQAISSRHETSDPGGESSAPSGLWLAYLVALGIGLHNLAEGLAIGSSFALGRVSLGVFLVVGFMLHNVTEGPAIIAPIARESRPELRHFVALGLLAGAPVILGGWIGGLAYSPTVGAFFLAIGVGAIFQVNWEIVKIIQTSAGRVGTPLNLMAFLAGLAVMYATDLLVVI